MTSTPSVIGGACIIASVCVGEWHLGLLSAGAGAWTSWSTLAIILTMVVMTVSGWMLLEALKPTGALTASANSVTKDLQLVTGSISSTTSPGFISVGGILLLPAYPTCRVSSWAACWASNSQLASGVVRAGVLLVLSGIRPGRWTGLVVLIVSWC